MTEHRRREPAPGVFRLVLPLPFPGLTAVNAFLLRGGADTTLVDCGIYDPDPAGEHGWDALAGALAACDASPGDVKRLVVTHPHIDHYGMAARFVEATGCELVMHQACESELDLYRDPDERVGRLKAMLTDHGVGIDDLGELTAFEDWRPYVSSVVSPSTAVAGGETFDCGTRVWEIVHTPGHSASHVCIWSSSDRLLISGDHLLPTITPHIDFHREEGADPLGDFLASLQKVESLDPAMVLPGHGRPFEEGAERARVVARHHDRRLGGILQVIRNEPRSANEIVDEIFGRELLNFDRRLALGEALAHLVYLRKRGEIERIEQDGTFMYRKVRRRRSEDDD